MVTVNCLECGEQFKTYSAEIKKGGGKFCSRSCATRYRNKTNNPAKREDVRKKISENHADVSGVNNPMFGKRGELAPSYIDGRNKYKGSTYQKIMQVNQIEKICKICGSTEKLNVHHIDGNHKNNVLSNLTYLCAKCHQNIAHEMIRDNKGKFLKRKEGGFCEQR